MKTVFISDLHLHDDRPQCTAAFLSFLHRARGGRSWRDATEADHVAYLVWRRRDEHGPQVADRTWDREVAAVNRFYTWQVRAGAVRANPIPQEERRRSRRTVGWSTPSGGESPATYSHGAGREKVEWMPAVEYRRWRDVGVRGYSPAGLPDPRFRGRWAARNATFCDLMVRTGLRRSEQAALGVFEVPLQRCRGGFQRFWLAPAIAKGSSARWVYVPGAVAAELADYVEIDRAEVVATARAAGRYTGVRRPLVIEDPARPETARGPHGVRVATAQLDPRARVRLLVDGPDGLEPAALWLSERGLPMAPSSWNDMFAVANQRCAERGVALRAHPHLLRHTFAVITLEQLQRGHLAALGGLTAAQRGHYTRVFGDPLDWVRRRLGHRSGETTQIYLHALAELEMETRMALVPDDWDDPREHADLDETTADRVELGAAG